MKHLLRILFIACLLAQYPASFCQTSLQPQWLAQTDLPLSTGTISTTDAARTANDETYVIGSFTNGADFDTGPDTFYVRAPYNQGLFLAKYDKKGKLLFAEGFSGYGEKTYYYFQSVATDNSGSAYITGRYGRYLDFDPGPGYDSLPTSNYYDNKMFIAKYASDGALVWVKTVYSQNNKSYTSAIAADRQGNICITGILYGGTNDFDPGPGMAALKASQDGDIFFATYNTNGGFISAQLLSNSGGNPNDVAMDANSNVFITGSYSKTVDFDPGAGTATLTAQGKGDAFVAKYTLSGGYLFAKSIGGKGDDYGNRIQTDNKKNIYLTGAFSGVNADFDPGAGKVLRSAAGSSNADVFVEKLDSAGNYIWVSTAGGTAVDYPSCLALDSSGNVYTGSYLQGDSILFPNTSGSDTLYAKGTAGFYFARYNSLGTCLYVQEIESKNAGYSANLFISSQNKIVLTGNFSDTIDLNPAAKRNLLYSPFNTVYFGNYNSANGQYQSGSKIDLFGWYNDESKIYRVTGDTKGNTYTIGEFQGITDFDPGPPDTVLVTSANSRIPGPFYSADDRFFAKYDAAGKLVFLKTIPATAELTLTNITVDEDENIYICGAYGGRVNFSPGSDSAVFGTSDPYKPYAFFVKYDKSGNYKFSKNLKMLGSFAAVAIDNQKNIYVAGNFSNKANFSDPDSTAVLTATGGTDLFYGKYDSTGKYIFIKQVGQKGEKNTAGATDMKITPSGRMIICGELIGNKTDFDPGTKTYYLSSGKAYDAYYVAAYNLQGDFLFATTADTASTGQSYATNLALDGEDILVSGTYRGAVDLDPGPKVTEQATIAVYSNFFIKFRKNGAFLFSHAFIPTELGTGGSNNSINGIGVDSTHHIYIGGWYAQKTDFDFGAGTAYLSGAYGGSYLARYDSLGNYNYVQGFDAYPPAGGYDYNYATALWVGRQNEVVLAGYGSGNADFDPGAGSLLFHAPVYGHYSLYIAKYKDTGSMQKSPLLITKMSRFSFSR